MYFVACDVPWKPPAAGLSGRCEGNIISLTEEQMREMFDTSLLGMITPENFYIFLGVFLMYWATHFVFKQLVKLIEQM